MDDRRVGTAVRALRLRRGWRQEDLAARARTSRWTVARVERGYVATVRVDTLRRIAEALEARLDLLLRWQGGDLDRLLNARHGRFHELVARRFAACPGWVAVPEVTFSIYGERGVIDVLAWHAASRTILVVELKTEIVDVQELIGTLDRKRRLALEIAESRGWNARHVATWLAIAEGSTNRRRVGAHRTVLSAALPDPAARVGRWLADPAADGGRRPLAALSFVSEVQGSRTRSDLATPRRVGRGRPRTTPDQPGAKRAPSPRLTTRGGDSRT